MKPTGLAALTSASFLICVFTSPRSPLNAALSSTSSTGRMARSIGISPSTAISTIHRRVILFSSAYGNRSSTLQKSSTCTLCQVFSNVEPSWVALLVSNTLTTRTRSRQPK